MLHVTRTLTPCLLLSATLGLAQTPTVYRTMGIIGSATAAGWVVSTPMSLPDPTDPHSWTVTLPLVPGEVKFRANDDWAFNWGTAAFPTGQAVSNGPTIPVPMAGTYLVQFHDASRGYTFIRLVQPTATKTASRVLRPVLLPNPAREAVRVAYDLPAAGLVTVSVHNLLGQAVRRAMPTRQGAGPQEQELAVAGLAPGWYLVRVQSGGSVETARLLVD